MGSDSRRRRRTKPKSQEATPSSAQSPSAGAQRWQYDKGGDRGNRRKHVWGNAYAGFVRVDGKWVGKCPNNLLPEVRQQELNAGIEVDADELTLEASPSRIYVVYDGVVYRAEPTNPAAGSWHAFPETPENLQGL